MWKSELGDDSFNLKKRGRTEQERDAENTIIALALYMCNVPRLNHTIRFRLLTLYMQHEGGKLASWNSFAPLFVSYGS